MQWIRRNLWIIVPVGVAAVVGVAYIAFGVFGIQTLFVDDTVDEAGPVFDSGATDVVDSTPVTGAEAPNSTPVATPKAPVAAEAPAPEIVTLSQGSFIPRGRYSGEGTALVLNDGSAQRFLRFENFSTDNGPDLNVYLSTSDANADSGMLDDEFVDLGRLKGNIGDQNYEIPPEVDLGRFDTVVVWCVRFSTPFTAADLVPTV